MTTIQMTFVNPFVPQQIPSPPPKTKPKLRSCLSPSRSPSITPYADDSAAPTPSGSRSTSFSSCTSANGDGWKRTKCVRWQEMNGCAVTSTHDTYSHEEYDRTPLEPPSVAERECVLPERGSRCLSLSRDCFLSDSNSYLDDDEDESEDTSADSYFLNTPPPTETCSEDGEADEHDARDREDWEECMDRRRQMFAMMCPQLRQLNGGHHSPVDHDRHPEFEGYKSISATLANLLKLVSDDQNEHPADQEGEEEQEGVEEVVKGDSCGFGFTSLTRDIPEIDTPSLVSSESELGLDDDDCIIQSPGGSSNGSGNSTMIPNVPQQHQQQGMMCAEELVMAAWSNKQKQNERGRERMRREI
ncbi:uncharacterized protein L199_003214 [Kwoniella botswanensis]|uniref:uncharacterized protein n=1 Tax=Kwoniella botswanensis TaxID=1268659 RepID=UPI00315CC410